MNLPGHSSRRSLKGQLTGMLGSLDKMFESLTALLAFMVAAILGILFWMVKTPNDF